VRRAFDIQPASRVVEEPRRNILPYFAVAILAGAVVWTMQQRSVQEPALPQAKTLSQQIERDRQGPNSAKGDLRTLFSADDYPTQAQTKGEEGTVQAELLVDASGKVSGCTILRSSGSAALDTATCSILSRRAHFYPAHDVNGNAVQDIVRTPPIVWRLED
jgi:TonB family protein